MSLVARLTGMTLDGGWEVLSRIPLKELTTGGTFCVGYRVRNRDGRPGFLKALDYRRALRAPDPALALQKMTEAFNFERDLLRQCRAKRLDRIVLALDDGTMRIPDDPDGEVVQYLVFELADGDVRSCARVSHGFDLAWKLRALHHVGTGLWQLHNQGIAHQDLKPSNVLVFHGSGSKVADLGRAATKKHTLPHHDLDVAGDRTYAPPELLYGHIDTDWDRRRFGCDAYLLGSMVVFFFLGTGMTPLVVSRLRLAHRPEDWRGSYREVLPYLRVAGNQVVQDLEGVVPSRARGDVIPAVQQLCEPDPVLRGHPLNRRTRRNQYSVERYVSLFNLLARRAELGLLKGVDT